MLRFAFFLRDMSWLLFTLLTISASLSAAQLSNDTVSIVGPDQVGNFSLKRQTPASDISREMAIPGQPIFLTEDQVVQLLDGQWSLLIDAMRQALVAAASKEAIQLPRSTTSTGHGGLLTMPGYVGSVKTGKKGSGEEVLACKLVTRFEENPRRVPPLPAILATILLFDVTSGKLTCILEGTEITARRTAAASVAATKILYNQRHSRSEDFIKDSLVLGILGAGVQGRSHAIAFHAAHPNISQIRIWNHRLPKAERLVAELKALGIQQAVVARTGEECAQNADILVTATNANTPILRREWVKDGAHINAVGFGATHNSELDLPLYQKAKIYLDDEASGRKELHGLEILGIPLIATVGDLALNPDLIPGKREVTVFHSLGMAAEDALAAQLVYKQYLLTLSKN